MMSDLSFRTWRNARAHATSSTRRRQCGSRSSKPVVTLVVNGLKPNWVCASPVHCHLRPTHLLDSGASANLNLPSNLAPGNYLLRHEIIALQNGVSEGGAEFYASCSQLSVGGSGSGAPSASELVKFPGAYSATDPGILVDVGTLFPKRAVR
jgi:hypothetical protein